MSDGGSLKEVTVGGRIFPATSDADAQIDIGGYTVELSPNGDGKTVRKIKTIKPWSFDGVVVQVDPDRDDQQFLQGTIDGKDDVELSLTMVDDTTYVGTGTITGDLKVSTMNATAPLAFGGGGKAEKQ